MDAPKPASTALANANTTSLGKQLDARAKQQPGLSGFDLLIDDTEAFDAGSTIQPLAAHPSIQTEFCPASDLSPGPR